MSSVSGSSSGRGHDVITCMISQVSKPAMQQSSKLVRVGPLKGQVTGNQTQHRPLSHVPSPQGEVMDSPLPCQGPVQCPLAKLDADLAHLSTFHTV